MQDKLETFEVKTEIKCQNCERPILVGETATQLPDLDVQGTKGGILCSNCTTSKKNDKAAKAAADKAAAEQAKAAKAAADKAKADQAAADKAAKAE